MAGKKNVNSSLGLRLGFIFFIVILSAYLTRYDKKDGEVSIGISQLIENPVLDLSREGFIKALEDNGYKNGENIKIDTHMAQGDLTLATMIAQNFLNENKDLIFSIATPSAQASFNATKEVPILFTAVTDPVSAGLLENTEAPEKNVTGTVDLVPMKKQFQLGMKFKEDARAVGIPYNNSEVNSQIQVKEAKIAADELGLDVVEIPVNNSSELEAALNAKISDVDFLFLPSDNLIASSVGIVKKVSIENKLPVIGVDKPMLEKGALACEGLDYFKLGYDTGLMAVDILKGKKIQDIPVGKTEETDLIINKTMLDILGLDIPEGVEDAILIEED